MRGRTVSWLVLLVALHSGAVGALLLAAPAWAASFAGWQEEIRPTFFVRQAGVFHFVVMFAYLWEWRRHRSVGILVFTKSLAFVFLIGFWALSLARSTHIPWSIPFSGVADGLMGAVVGLFQRQQPAVESPPSAGIE